MASRLLASVKLNLVSRDDGKIFDAERAADVRAVGRDPPAAAGLLCVLAWSAARFNLSVGGEGRYAAGLYVSGDFFNVLGVRPLLGRTFTNEDDTAACPNPGAVISHAFWQREFGGDPGVIGRNVSLDGHTFPIVGVTPAAFIVRSLRALFDGGRAA